MRRTVHVILRLEQGEWPPGSSPSPVVNTFRQYLISRQYNHTVVTTAVAAVNQFLRNLQRVGKGPEEASPADVSAFVQEKRRHYEKRHRSPPPSERSWRSRYTGPVHRMLRLVDPEWPRPEPPGSEAERLRRDLIEDFARWLTDDRGLSEEMRRTRCRVAEDLLCWLEAKGLATSTDFTFVEVDGYLEIRLRTVASGSQQGCRDGLERQQIQRKGAGFCYWELMGVFRFAQNPRNWFVLLVAGEGFEPSTFGL